MNNTIKILAQYEENYSWADWDGKGECPQGWKFKGSATLEVTLSDDARWLNGEDIAKAAKLICEQRSGDSTRLTYVSHEIPESVDWEVTEDEWEKALKEANPPEEDMFGPDELDPAGGYGLHSHV